MAAGGLALYEVYTLVGMVRDNEGRLWSTAHIRTDVDSMSSETAVEEYLVMIYHELREQSFQFATVRES
jgi:hypothetical protein